jgi:hypothetical protein
MSPRRVLTALAALGLVAALSPLLAPPAGAGNGLEVNAFALGNQHQPEFGWEVEFNDCLSGTTGEVQGVPGAVFTVDDPNNGSVLLPASTPGGEYLLEITCTTDAGTRSGIDDLEFARVLVTKGVTGDVPPGTEFTVLIECSTFEEGAGSTLDAEGVDALNDDLVFGAGGGTQPLFAYTEQGCDVSEPDDGGAQSVTIETEDCGSIVPNGAEGLGENSFFIIEAVDCTQTVTNEFAPAQVEPADDVPDVVAATPPFTG